MVDARKIRLDADAAWALLKAGRRITIVKGSKVQSFSPKVDGQSAILTQALGPSGNLRAPAYRIKDDFVIGFNPEFYRDWLHGK